MTVQKSLTPSAFEPLLNYKSIKIGARIERCIMEGIRDEGTGRTFLGSGGNIVDKS